MLLHVLSVLRGARALLCAGLLALLGFSSSQAQDAERIDSLLAQPALADSLISVPPPSAGLLTLDEVMRQALEQNYGIRIAENNAAIALNDASLGNAGFLPTLSLSLNQNNVVGASGGRFGGGGGAGVGVGGAAGAGGFEDYNTTTAAATLNWTVFDGLRRPATLRRLETQGQQGVLLAEADAEGTLLDVITAYYDVVRQRQLLAVLQSTVALSEERVRIAALQARVGTASRLDADLARVDLNADRTQLLRQDVALLNAKNTLLQLLAVEGPRTFRVADTIQVETAFDYEAVLGAALADNRQLQSTRLEETVARQELREVRAEYLPTLSVSAGYELLGFSEGASPDPFNQDDTFTYGLSMSLPLFDGFNRERRSENARVRIENARLAEAQEETRIRTDVENAYQTYVVDQRLVRLERDNLDVARQNVRVAFRRLQVGTIAPVQLRDVQVALLEAESRLIEAAFLAKQSELELLRLSGQLLELAEARANAEVDVEEP